MAEITRIAFDYQELVTIMIKKEGIHEGIWEFYIRFGLNAANISTEINSKDEEKDSKKKKDERFIPSAILTIPEIGIHRTDKLNNLSVDASVVNPRSKKGRTKK